MFQVIAYLEQMLVLPFFHLYIYSNNERVFTVLTNISKNVGTMVAFPFGQDHFAGHLLGPALLCSGVAFCLAS